MSAIAPRVTVAVPVYNGGNYLAQALESALAQTYGDTEIIVVNDGSTDGGATRDISKRYGDRIRYIERKHGGVSSALNAAIAEMTGDVFCWLSHDDLFMPEKIEAQVKFHRTLGDPAACLFSDYEVIDGAGKHLSFGLIDHAEMIRAPQLALYRGQINGCTVYVPRQVLAWAGPFDESDGFTQDYRLWARIASRYDFFHQPEVLVKTRQHADQGSRDHRFALEVDRFWQALIAESSEIQRVQMEGSSRRFYARTADLLRTYTQSLRAAALAESAVGAKPRFRTASVRDGAAAYDAATDYLVFVDRAPPHHTDPELEAVVLAMAEQGALAALSPNPERLGAFLVTHRLLLVQKSLAGGRWANDVAGLWQDLTGAPPRRKTLRGRLATVFDAKDRAIAPAVFWKDPFTPPRPSEEAETYVRRARSQRQVRALDTNMPR